MSVVTTILVVHSRLALVPKSVRLRATSAPEAVQRLGAKEWGVRFAGWKLHMNWILAKWQGDLSSLCQKPLKSLLINNHIPNRLQPLPPILLLIQQLPPPPHIARMQLTQHILPKRRDRLPRQHLPPHRRLDHDFKHLPIHMLLELGDPRAPDSFRLAVVQHARHGVDGDFIDEEFELLQAGAAEACVFVVEGGVALCGAFELAEEVVDEVGEGEVVFEDDLGGGEEGEALLLAAIGFAELDHFAEVLFRQGDGGADVGFLQFADFVVGDVLVGEVGGVVENGLGAVFPDYFVGHAGRRNDDAGSVLLSESVFEYGTMQRAEEAETEAGTEGLRGLFGRGDAAVVKHQLVYTILKVRKVFSVDWKCRYEDHRLGFLEARKGLHKLQSAGMGKSVARLGILTSLHAWVKEDVTKLTSSKKALRSFIGIHDADFANYVFGTGGERGDMVSGFDLTLKYADKQNNTFIVVVPRVYEQ